MKKVLRALERTALGRALILGTCFLIIVVSLAIHAVWSRAPIED